MFTVWFTVGSGVALAGLQLRNPKDQFKDVSLSPIPASTSESGGSQLHSWGYLSCFVIYYLLLQLEPPSLCYRSERHTEVHFCYKHDAMVTK